MIKEVRVTVTEEGDGIACITKRISGFNNLELVGLYAELLEELKNHILDQKRIMSEKK